MTRNQEIAQVIRTQMGGGNRLVAMVGAKDFVAIQNGLQFKHMRSNGINMVRVVLDEGKDLYTMEFLSAHGGTLKQKAFYEEVYCDQLKELFETTTGLYLSI